MLVHRLKDIIDIDAPKTDLDRQVKKEIEELRKELFNPKFNTTGSITVRWKAGALKENRPNVYEVRKRYPVQLWGGKQGEWRYTSQMPRVDGKDKMEFVDHHKIITDPIHLEESQIDLIWYLLKHSGFVRSGKGSLENLEANEKQEAYDRSKYAALLDWVYNRIDNDDLVEVATAIGIEQAESLKENTLKNRVYDTVLEGDKIGDLFASSAKFFDIVQSKEERRNINKVRNAIKAKLFVYNKSDRGWYTSDGTGTPFDRVFVVPPADIKNPANKLVYKVVNDDVVREKIFSHLGDDEKPDYTLEGMREMKRVDINSIADDLNIPTKTSTSSEKIIEEICKKTGVTYVAIAKGK